MFFSHHFPAPMLSVSSTFPLSLKMKKSSWAFFQSFWRTSAEGIVMKYLPLTSCIFGICIILPIMLSVLLWNYYLKIVIVEYHLDEPLDWRIKNKKGNYNQNNRHYHTCSYNRVIPNTAPIFTHLFFAPSFLPLYLPSFFARSIPILLRHRRISSSLSDNRHWNMKLK